MQNIINNKINLKYVRPLKKTRMEEWYHADFYCKNELAVKCVNNGTIVPLVADNKTLFGSGGIIDEKGKYLEISGIPERYGGIYEFHKPEYRDESIVYLGYYMRHWGHFLTEVVSRCWYVLSNDKNVDRYAFICNANCEADLSGNYLEFFKLLGIADKIVFITKPTCYREVIIPEIGYCRPKFYSKQFCNMFEFIAEKAMLQPSVDFYEKIYFSRSGFKKARETELGLDLLDNYFSKNGFHVIEPEKISLAQMIQYIRNARVCASSSGTLPHNFLFAQDEKKIIIVDRQACINEYQINIDLMKNLYVEYIDGNYTVKPSYIGSGPFIFSYNKIFSEYSDSRGMLPPDQIYLSERYVKKNLITFYKTHKRFYQYTWGMESWQGMYLDLLFESYQGTLDEIGNLLNGNKPLFIRDYFQLSYCKRLLKKIMGR